MEKNSTGDSYDYDLKTDTVRVRRHDLWRLILEFRSLLEIQDKPGWSHMQDYDLSFERLADAIDHGNIALSGNDPDYRMRCNLSPVYRWPKGAPYDGQPVTAAVTVRDGDTRKDYGSHYLLGRLDNETLCGFRFAWEEAKRITTEPDCRECRRELALANELHGGEPRRVETAD
jgi:hypothetical protein